MSDIAKMIAIAKKFGGGGGSASAGGGGRFIVRAVPTEDMTSATIDRSILDIVDAYNNGRDVVCVLATGSEERPADILLPLVQYTLGEADYLLMFSVYVAGATFIVNMNRQIVSGDEHVDLTIMGVEE